MTVSFLTHEHAQRKDNRKSVLHKDIMKYELHKKTIYLEVSISFLDFFEKSKKCIVLLDSKGYNKNILKYVKKFK